MTDHKELRADVRFGKPVLTQHAAALLADYDRVTTERERLFDLMIECNRDGDVWWVAGRGSEVYPMRDLAVAAIEALLKGSE